MSRSLVLSNGRFFINFDELYRIRDIYFPHIGIANHSEGHPFLFGVFAEGGTHWVDEGWERSIAYEDGSLVGAAVLRNSSLQLEIALRDAIDFEIDAFVRAITVRDLSGRPRDIRVFLHQDFHISGSELGDTALFDPQIASLIHYKRDRYFLIGGGTAPDYRFDNFATGKKRMSGAEGTWRDAEGDGTLSGNPIAQGSVDSVIALALHVPASGDTTAYYWIAACERYGGLLRLDERIRGAGPAELIDRTARYWRLWVRANEPVYAALPPQLIPLYETSLLVARAHVDESGAIIAAADSDITNFARDTYTYVWPRDGALVATAFDRAGFPSVSRRFFAFAAALIKREGYFLHKYHPDRSLASSWHPWVDERGRPILPIQEDETGLVVWALWRHFERYRSIEEVQPAYRPFVLRAATFMAGYRDATTGLPLPSWDLWEERRGVMTFTCAAVWAGLDAAARFADAFGDRNPAAHFRQAAAEVKSGVLEHLWDEREGRFLRMIVPANAESGLSETRDATPDVSLFGLHFLRFLPPDDARLVATLDSVADALAVRTEIGGTARYRGDSYYAGSKELDMVPGNPWFVAQAWVAQWRIARARNEQELQDALAPVEWILRRASPAGLMPEQLHPYTGAPLAVTPLTWSHAAFVNTACDYLEKARALSGGAFTALPAETVRPILERALR
jgi:GH15 family glucan-1,4-alpha-glucosidase